MQAVPPRAIGKKRVDDSRRGDQRLRREFSFDQALLLHQSPRSVGERAKFAPAEPPPDGPWDRSALATMASVRSWPSAMDWTVIAPVASNGTMIL